MALLMAASWVNHPIECVRCCYYCPIDITDNYHNKGFHLICYVKRHIGLVHWH